MHVDDGPPNKEVLKRQYTRRQAEQESTAPLAGVQQKHPRKERCIGWSVVDSRRTSDWHGGGRVPIGLVRLLAANT